MIEITWCRLAIDVDVDVAGAVAPRALAGEGRGAAGRRRAAPR